MAAFLKELNPEENVIKSIDLYANICHNDIKATGQLRGDFDERVQTRAIAYWK